MRESVRTVASRHLVAIALAGVLSFSLHQELSGAEGPPLRADIVGTAIAIDGDTIHIAGHRVRLEGIDAPESDQTCEQPASSVITPAGSAAEPWACGRNATRALVDLIAGATIVCTASGKDKYGRTLGICYRDSLELNAEMVRAGHAWAFVKYSQRYVAIEAEARDAHRGIWQAPSMPAWDFRAGRWQVASAISPEGCAIKGNVSRHGHIYHMPWSRWYGRVTVDEKRGERWFCSEQEAIDAGFRPAGSG